MSLKLSNDTLPSRPTYSIRPIVVSEVLCHRLKDGREQYLIRWRIGQEPPVHPRAICSWHWLEDLATCLHHVQAYVETRKTHQSTLAVPSAASSLLPSRKRKSPDADPLPSRDTANGVLTPLSSRLSPAPSVIDLTSTSDAADVTSDDAGNDVYNGVLERKEGRIVAKKAKHVKVPKINVKSLPTSEMAEEAAKTPVTQAERLIRQAFYRKIEKIPRLEMENAVDSTTPSLDFVFVKDYVLRDGVSRLGAETMEGCRKKCKPNMGQGVGCEYPRDCECLEYAAVNEEALARESVIRYEEYLRFKENGGVQLEDLPKRFPYHKPSGDDRIPQTLVSFYRESRHPIYECNELCKCGPVCKSRVVQKGRRVPLRIFKTRNRGWGVYCTEDLIQGEFIDTYLGEVITGDEADERETKGGKVKNSFLFSLDKFIDDVPGLDADNSYVVDGQYMGNATRFINHSCEPNCRQYTVSYNKNDYMIYQLAFFAYEFIEKGTELTFDYMDKDEEEEEDVVRKREAAARDPMNVDKKPCNCGAQKCRGYLWV